jgi:hypothetical protein
MNTADQKFVDKMDKKDKSRQNIEKDDLVFLLSHRQGRRYLWRLMAKCGVYQISAVTSGSTTYYNEGRREIGLNILNEIMEFDPESYLLMIKENKEERLK